MKSEITSIVLTLVGVACILVSAGVSERTSSSYLSLPLLFVGMVFLVIPSYLRNKRAEAVEPSAPVADAQRREGFWINLALGIAVGVAFPFLVHYKSAIHLLTPQIWITEGSFFCVSFFALLWLSSRKKSAEKTSLPSQPNLPNTPKSK